MSGLDASRTGPSLREDLISTAVKFLSNPNIQRSPLEQKQRFLRSKGLTEDEISTAFERGAALLSVPSMASGDLLMYRHSRASWLREVLINVAVFGGIAYGFYWLYKKVFESLLFGDRPRKKTLDERLVDLKKSFDDSMFELKQEMITVRSEVDRLNNSQTCNAATRNQIENLKSDIASIKGILLNRNQFPPIRTEPPSIPAWQLQSSVHHPSSDNDVSPPQSDHEKEPKEQDDDIIRMRGERSQSGGSHSSDGDIVTKNSDSSSLEIIT